MAIITCHSKSKLNLLPFSSQLKWLKACWCWLLMLWYAVKLQKIRLKKSSSCYNSGRTASCCVILIAKATLSSQKKHDLGHFLIVSLMLYVCDEQHFNVSVSLLFFFSKCRGENGGGKIVKTDSKVTAEKVEKVITLHFYFTLLVMHLGGS